MHTPPVPIDEASRLASLHALDLLDSNAEERFDRITRLGQRCLDVPICPVSLIDRDRQWFKSKQGLGARETAREVSFCGHTICAPEVMVVPDARQDPRFADNPLVVGEPHVIFYAGYPLTTPTGARVGTLCAIDHRPREPDEAWVDALCELGTLVEQELRVLQLAHLDELTELPLRRDFQTHTAALYRDCMSRRLPASVIFFDLDGFELINDTYGHRVGDDALRCFASVLKRVFRETDKMCRLGGDEFVVMLPNCERPPAEKALARMRRYLAQLFQEGEAPADIRFSAGLVTLDADSGVAIEEAIALADKAMYRTKRSGAAAWLTG